MTQRAYRDRTDDSEPTGIESMTCLEPTGIESMTCPEPTGIEPMTSLPGSNRERLYRDRTMDVSTWIEPMTGLHVLLAPNNNITCECPCPAAFSISSSPSSAMGLAPATFLCKK